MATKCVSWSLVAAFSFVLCLPAEAQSGGKPIGGVTTGDVVAGIVGAVAVVAVVAFVVIHESAKKRTITGCVRSGANGMTVTDEKDNQVYALSGDTEGITAGDRMKLHGKKLKLKGPDKNIVWEARGVVKDFGVCQP